VGGNAALHWAPRLGARQIHAAPALPLLPVSHCIQFALSTLFHSDLHQERAFFLSCFETTLQKMVAFCAVVNPFGHVASCLVRWFLRKYPGMAGCSPADKEHFEYPIGEADLFNILPLTLSSYRL
jgi:hypothetical protein